MNNIIFQACKAKFIGPILYLTGFCTFPPLFSNIKIPLDQVGTEIKINISAPATAKYDIYMITEYNSENHQAAVAILDSNKNTRECTRPSSTPYPTDGRPLNSTPLHIKIKSLENESEKQDFFIQGECNSSRWQRNSAGRLLTTISLKAGNHQLSITNTSSNKNLSPFSNSILMEVSQNELK